MHFPEPLNHLDQDSLQVLESITKSVSFEAGTRIFEINSAGDCCFIIDEGQVRLEIPPKGGNPDDHENVLNILEPGALLGEMALLDNLPRSATAYAHTAIKARRIESADLLAMVATHPQVTGMVYAALGRVASLKLREYTDRLAGFIFKADNPLVNDMVGRAQAAQKVWETWQTAEVDKVLAALARAVADHAEELARLNVEETHIGNVTDKIFKIRVGSLGIYHSLADKAATGTINTEADGKIVDIAAPVGVVFGLVPVTNPVSTFIFKVLTCLKGRNAVILSASRRSQMTANRTGALVQEVLKAHGAPLDLVQWVKENNSRKMTADFMKHEGISFILATGGPSMVKAAYSSGTPAIGVGAGNAPTWVCTDANLQEAAERIVASKSFDNGVVCCSEHNLVVDVAIRDQFIQALEAAGAAVLSPAQVVKFTDQVVEPHETHFKDDFIGQPAVDIAKATDIQRPYPIKLIVVPVESVDPAHAYSHEKLAPILSLFTVEGEEEGLRICQQLLTIDGTGHTAIIYTSNEALINRFGMLMPASRILVNSPGVQGGLGITTALAPSLTLGCGTFGHTSTTDNVTYKHILNVKRVAYYIPEALPL